MATVPPADPLDVLASLYASPFLVRLTALSRASGWRLELSEDDGGTWTSLEAGRPGHASPAAAIEEGVRLIQEWRSSRVTAHDAEISHFFREGKLERARISVIDEETRETIVVDGYKALAEDGSWTEDIEPIKAIERAKQRKGTVKPSDSFGSSDRSSNKPPIPPTSNL